MAKRLNKTDIARGKIFDQIAGLYGNSVLGFYDGKLRIELIDEETGEVIQFSIAPVMNKTLVDESECEPYRTIDERIEEYQSSLKKNDEKNKKTSKKKEEEKVEEKVPETEQEKESLQELSEEETKKLEDVMKSLGL